MASGVWYAACVLRLRTLQSRTANKTAQPTAPRLRLGAKCRFVYRKHFGGKISACGVQMPISDDFGALFWKMTRELLEALDRKARISQNSCWQRPGLYVELKRRHFEDRAQCNR